MIRVLNLLLASMNKIFEINTNELKAYEKNAKTHPEDQVKKIADSIKKYGFNQPIVVDSDNVIIVGHGRLLAAVSLGMETVPVIRKDDLTQDDIKAYQIRGSPDHEARWFICLSNNK